MLALQENIDFDEVGVILVNDGEENEFMGGCLKQYPFEICQMSIPHGGVSKARNAGLDASDADWVMFCDCDDSFASIFALYTIFCGMHEEKYNLLITSFVEETVDNDGVMHIVNHDEDTVFVHGKAMKRQWLIDNNLRFNEQLTIHEDGFFNVLTYAIAGADGRQVIKTPLYVWKWNPHSVVRRDNADDYVLDTYDHLMRQRIALTEEFTKRQMASELTLTVVKTIIDCYYDFQQHTWRLPKNKAKYERAERWFAAYLKRYALLYAKANIKMIGEVASVARARNVMRKTFLIESETLKQWLEHIMNDVRPIPRDEQGI